MRTGRLFYVFVSVFEVLREHPRLLNCFAVGYTSFRLDVQSVYDLSARLSSFGVRDACRKQHPDVQASEQMVIPVTSPSQTAATQPHLRAIAPSARLQ